MSHAASRFAVVLALLFSSAVALGQPAATQRDADLTAARAAAEAGQVAAVQQVAAKYPGDQSFAVVVQYALLVARQQAKAQQAPPPPGESMHAPAEAQPPAPPAMPVVAGHPDRVQKLLYAKDDDDREDAAKKLEKVGTPPDINPLVWSAANDKDGDTRKHAARAIGKILSRYALPRPPAPPIVAGTQGHADLAFILAYARHDHSREEAAEDLAKYGLPQHVPLLIWAAAFNRDGDTRKESAKAIVKICKHYNLAPPPRPVPQAAPPPPPPPAE